MDQKYKTIYGSFAPMKMTFCLALNVLLTNKTKIREYDCVSYESLFFI